MMIPGMNQHEMRTELIEMMYQTAVAHGPTRLASGRRSMYRINAEQVAFTGRGQNLIGRLGFRAIVNEPWRPIAIGGPADGARSIATAIAFASALERQSPINAFAVLKDNTIEGWLKRGQNVVMVEDVITTGKSVLRAIQAVERFKARVLGVWTLVDREEGGKEVVETAGYKTKALFTAKEILSYSPSPNPPTAA